MTVIDLDMHVLDAQDHGNSICLQLNCYQFNKVIKASMCNSVAFIKDTEDNCGYGRETMPNILRRRGQQLHAYL